MLTSAAAQNLMRERLFDHTAPSESLRRSAPSVAPDTDLQTGSLSYTLGTNLPRLAESKAFHPAGNWLSQFGRNTGQATLGGAALGGLAGLGVGLATDRPVGQSVAMGAAAGGGGSAALSTLISLLNRSTVKQAFYADAETSAALPFIQQRIFADSSADGSVKGALLQQVQGLSSDQQQSLGRLLKGSVSGGAVYLIARFLLGLGRTSSLLLALVGGAAAAGGGNPRNAFGDRVDREHDVFGRRRFVF